MNSYGVNKYVLKNVYRNQIFTTFRRDKKNESCNPCWIYGIGMIKSK